MYRGAIVPDQDLYDETDPTELNRTQPYPTQLEICAWQDGRCLREGCAICNGGEPMPNKIEKAR